MSRKEKATNSMTKHIIANERGMGGTVVREWVSELPWKQQSILFSGLRGPDSDKHPNVKKVSRWMRSISQNNADPAKEYMKFDVDFMPTAKEVCDELEYLPCHFAHHFIDALAVIAYGHSSIKVKQYAYTIHAFFAEEVFHFLPEHPDIFNWRHRDKPNSLDSNPHRPFEDRGWMDNFLPEGYMHP